MRRPVIGIRPGHAVPSSGEQYLGALSAQHLIKQCGELGGEWFPCGEGQERGGPGADSEEERVHRGGDPECDGGVDEERQCSSSRQGSAA